MADEQEEFQEMNDVNMDYQRVKQTHELVKYIKICLHFNFWQIGVFSLLNWAVLGYFSFHFLCDGLYCTFVCSSSRLCFWAFILYSFPNLILPLLKVILVRSLYSSAPCNSRYFTQMSYLMN